jgi:hypothetical protein
MKVEYPLQLFKSFNKRIWSNKVFSYFVIALIIGFTVLLKQVPEIYYKYLLNPVLLLISMMLIIIITIYNFQLGLILSVSLITLYYPAKYYYKTNQVENFEGNILPIEKSDKNIVDDEQETQNNPDEDNESNEENEEGGNDVTESPSQNSDEEDNNETINEEPEIEQDEKETFKPSKEKFSGIRLERLNPSYFKNSTNQNNNKGSGNKASNNKVYNNKASNNKILKNNSSSVKEKLTDIKNPKNKKKDDETTFLGEVRNIFKDLDTGKNKMKATTAIKKINDLMYNKHKTDIQKILNEDDEDYDDEEDNSDDDYF